MSLSRTNSLDVGRPGIFWPDPFLSRAVQPFYEWDPFLSFDRSLVQRNPNQELATRGTSIDVVEKDNSFEVSADLPGYPKESIDIKVVNDSLHISAEKNEVIEEDTDTYHRRERSIGKVKRTIPLPQNTNHDDIKASFENGVLKVTIPKREISVAAKQIKIT